MSKTQDMPQTTRSAYATVAVASIAVALLAWPCAASAQSLGALAQSQKAKREGTPTPTKVYTNDSLRADITPSATVGAPTPSSAVGTPAPAATTSGGAPDAAEAVSGDKKDEAHWRKRIADTREQLSRAEAFAAALESQINGLTVDFLQRDDPAQRATIETNRKKAIGEHERVVREIADHKKAIAAIEDEARKAGVPAGWLR